MFPLSFFRVNRFASAGWLYDTQIAEIRATEERSTLLHRPGILIRIGRPAPGHSESTFYSESDPLDDLEACAASLSGISVGQGTTQPNWRHRNRDRDVDPHLVGSSESLPIGRDFKVIW